VKKEGKMKYIGKMYGHRLVGWTGEGHGLAGAYDAENRRLSDLALFSDRYEARDEADLINSYEEMAEVEVVEVEVTLEIIVRCNGIIGVTRCYCASDGELEPGEPDPFCDGCLP